MSNRPANLPNRGSKLKIPEKRRIFFGHQSVGLDILDGIRLLSPDSRIAEISGDSTSSGEYGIQHSRIGRNNDPHTKIDDFARIVSGAKTGFDIAMMKLCYVDVQQGTDIKKLFEHYRSTVRNVARLAPEVCVVHMTVPLRSIRVGPRSRIRLLCGSTLDAFEDNIQREAYNSLIVSEYGGDNHVFDLATIEATQPDGKTCSIRYKQQPVRSLYPEYSDDGGHLNDNGKRAIAGALIRLLDVLCDR